MQGIEWSIARPPVKGRATRKSLVDLVRAERDLSRLVGRPVDLVTEDALSPYLRDRVLKSARVLYDRAG